MPPSLAAFFFGEEENQVSSVVAVRRIRATSYSLLATGRLRHMALSNESFARVTQLTYFQSGSSIASVNDSIASVNDALALVSHLSGYQEPARGHQRYSPPNLFRINHRPQNTPMGVQLSPHPSTTGPTAKPDISILRPRQSPQTSPYPP